MCDTVLAFWCFYMGHSKNNFVNVARSKASDKISDKIKDLQQTYIDLK